MSKLGTLIAIPIALWGVKQLQKQFPDDPNAKPIGFTLGPAGTDMDIAPLFPEGLQLTTTIPGGAAVATGPTQPLGTGVTATGSVPFFPDTAASAAEEFAAKKPFEFGLFPALDLTGIGKDTFTSGFFDPEFQAGLRK